MKYEKFTSFVWVVHYFVMYIDVRFLSKKVCFHLRGIYDCFDAWVQFKIAEVRAGLIYIKQHFRSPCPRKLLRPGMACQLEYNTAASVRWGLSGISLICSMAPPEEYS